VCAWLDVLQPVAHTVVKPHCTHLTTSHPVHQCYPLHPCPSPWHPALAVSPQTAPSHTHQHLFLNIPTPPPPRGRSYVGLSGLAPEQQSASPLDPPGSLGREALLGSPVASPTHTLAAAAAAGGRDSSSGGTSREQQQPSPLQQQQQYRVTGGSSADGGTGTGSNSPRQQQQQQQGVLLDGRGGSLRVSLDSIGPDNLPTISAAAAAAALVGGSMTTGRRAVSFNVPSGVTHMGVGATRFSAEPGVSTEGWGCRYKRQAS
jgi:hypothetical protein